MPESQEYWNGIPTNIEKVIFDSRPGFPVTANLYVLKGRKHPLPAVIGTCGHGDPAKALQYINPLPRALPGRAMSF